MPTTFFDSLIRQRCRDFLECLSRENGRGMMEDWPTGVVQTALDNGWCETCRPCHRGDIRLTYVGWAEAGVKGF